MLLRSLLLASRHSLILVIRKAMGPIMIVVAGKEKENGKRTGERPMQGKDNLLCLSSILTGKLSGFCFNHCCKPHSFSSLNA